MKTSIPLTKHSATTFNAYYASDARMDKTVPTLKDNTSTSDWFKEERVIQASQ